MLRIRFSRTGKVGQPSFRIVVAEHRAPVKGRYIEMVGHYLPARTPKEVTVKKDRVEYWISKGAIPSDSVATLLKKEGFEKMDRYLRPRDRKRKSKKEGEDAPKGANRASGEAKAAPVAAPKAAPAKTAEPEAAHAKAQMPHQADAAKA